MKTALERAFKEVDKKGHGEELKACPFCGCDAPELINSIESWVTCPRCKPGSGMKNGAVSAIKAWNTRTVSPPKTEGEG